MSASEPVRQTPGAGEIFLDHVGWFAAGMGAAAAAFTRLGFPVTPYSVHGDRNPETGVLEPTGSANRLAMLSQGYLEVLTAVEGADTYVTRHLHACLARHAGVHLVAFTVADAETEALRLAADGFDILPTVNLRRAVEAADGSAAEVAFTVIRPRLGSIPEGRMQTITHLTPEHMWQERYIARENGIARLEEAVFAVEDPQASADRLSRFTQRPVLSDGEPVIALDRGRLRFMTADAASRFLGGGHVPDPPGIAAVGFSGDLERVGAMLSGSGVTPVDTSCARIVIGAGDACGTCIVVEGT